jgi:hypothetical protein
MATILTVCEEKGYFFKSGYYHKHLAAAIAALGHETFRCDSLQDFTDKNLPVPEVIIITPLIKDAFWGIQECHEKFPETPILVLMAPSFCSQNWAQLKGAKEVLDALTVNPDGAHKIQEALRRYVPDGALSPKPQPQPAAQLDPL